MSSKIVLCLRGSNPQEVLECFQTQDFLSRVDLVEIRMDYLDPKYFTKEIVHKFQESITKPLIFTFRSIQQGGIHSISQNIRFNLYLVALELNFEYIDIEITDFQELTQFLRGYTTATKIILSYHNFKNTNLDDIRNHYSKMASFSCDIIKIVTFVHSRQEASLMDTVQSEILHETSKVSIFGMGEHGKRSRLEGYMKNNYFTYISSTSGKQTAVGQLSLREFDHLLNY
jgi:3-dehydroquinate dehydratase type I